MVTIQVYCTDIIIITTRGSIIYTDSVKKASKTTDWVSKCVSVGIMT